MTRILETTVVNEIPKITTHCYMIEVLHEDNSNCLSSSLQLVIDGKETTVNNCDDTWKFLASIHGKGRICVFVTHYTRDSDWNRYLVSRIPLPETTHSQCRRLKIENSDWAADRLAKCQDKVFYSDYNRTDFVYDRKYDF